jgi:hypothetical protein
MTPNGKEILKESIRIRPIAIESARIALNRKASEGDHHRPSGRPVEAFVSNDFYNN